MRHKQNKSSWFVESSSLPDLLLHLTHRSKQVSGCMRNNTNHGYWRWLLGANIFIVLFKMQFMPLLKTILMFLRSDFQKNDNFKISLWLCSFILSAVNSFSRRWKFSIFFLVVLSIVMFSTLITSIQKDKLKNHCYDWT